MRQEKNQTIPATMRTAGMKDAPLLAEIIRAGSKDVAERFGLTPENAPKHPSNCTTEWVTSAMEKDVTYYLLSHEQTPCGCVALEQANPEVCYLERLAVLPEFRRRGFGQNLVKHTVREAGAKGCGRIEIGIIAAFTELRDWYARLGFIQTETKIFEHLPFQVTFMYLSITD